MFYLFCLSSVSQCYVLWHHCPCYFQGDQCVTTSSPECAATVLFTQWVIHTWCLKVPVVAISAAAIVFNVTSLCLPVLPQNGPVGTNLSLLSRNPLASTHEFRQACHACYSRIGWFKSLSLTCPWPVPLSTPLVKMFVWGCCEIDMILHKS